MPLSSKTQRAPVPARKLAPAAAANQQPPAAKNQGAKVRPLIVQAIAKQMQKLLAQRQLLTSPEQSDSLELKTPKGKK